MSICYLYGTILTSEAVAANNRGDNLGNTTTLQKVFVGDDLHTSVSAEAIRFALRYRFQLEGLAVNRTYDSDKGVLAYADEKHSQWDGTKADNFIDDDLMGFMLAEVAKSEGEEQVETETEPPSERPDEARKGGPKMPREERGTPKKPGDERATPKKPKGKTTKRQSPLAVGRAVSLRPYRGEISFNCVSGAKEEGALSLYAAEMHTTEYQYTFGLNMNDVKNKVNIGHLIDAIIDPPPVAGNHSRFAYDFSPASVIFRLTNCHSPKIQNCFEHDEETRGYALNRLVHRVKCKDVPAGELVVGGLVASSEFAKQLKAAGAEVFPGVLEAANKVKQCIAGYGSPFDVVSKNGKERQV
jgi:CRISPR-associated protein Cst2